MSVKIEISVGELLDKITILEIKSEQINNREKLVNINKELSVLRTQWKETPYSNLDIKKEITELKTINEALWEIEDKIRTKEKLKQFDEQFIALARSVYVTNDKRGDIKKRINAATNSTLTEEKSYIDYH